MSNFGDITLEMLYLKLRFRTKTKLGTESVEFDFIRRGLTFLTRTVKFCSKKTFFELEC